ncbi:hypothetical protein K0B04_01155 [Patescibacteria group bacterium]|nr:hypothetical protein [Patescibacteria group bacterium]
MPKTKISLLEKILKTLFILSTIFYFSISALAGTDPPATEIQLEPFEPDGNNGWYLQPVKVTLTGTDLDSGVTEINYRVDDGSWVKKVFSNSLNLAPNPSFETSWVRPPLNTQDWNVSNSNPGGSYSRDNLIYKSDFPNTSIKIGSTDDSWHSIDHYDMFAAATPFTNMSAYAWIKTSNVTGTAYFNIYSISQDEFGQKTTTFIKSSPTLTGTNDWKRLATNFTPTAENTIGVYLEIGFTGTGTIWIDAVNVNRSLVPVTSFYVSTDGLHTVEYYSVDKRGNIEETKSVNFKIDQTPPGNWGNAGAVRELSGDLGSDHRVYVWIEVTDETSGISPSSDKFQYTTNHQDVTTFGYFSDLLACNSDWIDIPPNNWLDTITIQPLGGNSVKLLTPKIDFCNNNWKICKWTRFYAEDNAGNSISKDICLNGPWIRVRGGGVVRANQNIDMVAEAPIDEENTDGLIEIGGNSINFFSSSENLYYANVNPPPEYNYDKIFNSTQQTKTEISTSGDLPTTSGVYVIGSGSGVTYEITKQKIPSTYNTATFNQVVFINGNLIISDDIEVSNASTALFVVSGNVQIDKKVENVKVGIVSDGDIHTAYNLGEGETCKTLNMSGIFMADEITFVRTLLGQNNEKNPAEDVIYEPKYVIKMAEYIGSNSTRWLYSD